MNAELNKSKEQLIEICKKNLAKMRELCEKCANEYLWVVISENANYVYVGLENGLNGTEVQPTCPATNVLAVLFPNYEDAKNEAGRHRYLDGNNHVVRLEAEEGREFFEKQIELAEQGLAMLGVKDDAKYAIMYGSKTDESPEIYLDVLSVSVGWHEAVNLAKIYMKNDMDEAKEAGNEMEFHFNGKDAWEYHNLTESEFITYRIKQI